MAVLIGGWLAVKTILEKGPTVTITFKTAEGLEAGKTKVKYKNVDVGEVRKIALSEDHSEIIATVEFEKQAENFWLTIPDFGSCGCAPAAAKSPGSGHSFQAPTLDWTSDTRRLKKGIYRS